MHASASSNHSIHWLYTRTRKERRRVKGRDDRTCWLVFCDSGDIDAQYRSANMLPLKSHLLSSLASTVHCQAFRPACLSCYNDLRYPSVRIGQLLESTRQSGTLFANKKISPAARVTWELAQHCARQCPNLLPSDRNETAAEHLQQSTSQLVIRMWCRFEWQIAQWTSHGATYLSQVCSELERWFEPGWECIKTNESWIDSH